MRLEKQSAELRLFDMQARAASINESVRGCYREVNELTLNRRTLESTLALMPTDFREPKKLLRRGEGEPNAEAPTEYERREAALQNQINTLNSKIAGLQNRIEEITPAWQSLKVLADRCEEFLATHKFWGGAEL